MASSNGLFETIFVPKNLFIESDGIMWCRSWYGLLNLVSMGDYKIATLSVTWRDEMSDQAVHRYPQVWILETIDSFQ